MTAWQDNQEALQRHLDTESIDTFLQWSTVRKTMYVGMAAAQMPNELDELKENRYTWMPTIAWTGFGGDVEKFEGHVSDPNLIHQAYHLKQWLDRTKQDLTEMSSIVEIGGGYGAMCLICRRLGFMGDYHIIDLPESQRIQQYYLGRNGVMALWSDLPKSCDLLIACHSLSEMPCGERERLLSQMAAKEYLFACSYEFEGVDNQAWFHSLGSTPGYDWTFYSHKWQENAFYQIGIEL